MTTESRELALYTINTGEIYRKQTQAVIANMARKMKQGKFDAELAIKAFEHVAETGARAYNKDFGTPDTNPLKMFSKSDRKLAAAEMLDHYMEQIEQTAKGEN